jgi:preprotein translocase SecE subunit
LDGPDTARGVERNSPLVFGEERFYIETTDTRRVGLRIRLCALLVRLHPSDSFFVHVVWICASDNKRRRDMASKTNPFTFLQQVRSETAKVTWPSRRETMISTMMVIVMAFVAAIFFFAADQLLGWGVELLLGLGN